MEKLLYFNLRNRQIFIHLHIPLCLTEKAIIFLNPLFEEKKTVQRFQVQTARELCKLNYLILRFDYYGTGDSQGKATEFDIAEIFPDLILLINYLKDFYCVSSIKLFGIRFGADLAILFSSYYDIVDSIILLEPLVKGSRYLAELDLKRKSFYKIRNMNPSMQNLFLNGHYFIDHLGFAISEKNIQFLKSIDLDTIVFNDKKLYFLKFTSVSQTVKLDGWINKLTKKNKITIKITEGVVFWNNWQNVDTSGITDSLIELISIGS